MNEYVLSVIGTVLLSALLTAIIPEGKTAATIKGVTKAVCVLIIVAPILSFFQSKDKVLSAEEAKENFFQENGLQTDEEFIEYVSTERVAFVEKKIERELFEEFSIEADVQIVWQEEMQEVGGYSNRQIYVKNIIVKGLLTQEQELQKSIIDYITKNYYKEVLLE